MPDHAPLTAVQLAELVFLGDEFDATTGPSSFLLAQVVPFARWCRAEGVTLPALVATGFDNIPPVALAPLVIAAAACAGGSNPFCRKLLAIADAMEAP